MSTIRLLLLLVLTWSEAVSAEADPSYDYIIVGAGTAGCVLAARLTEDAHSSVLLIEAGGEELGERALDVPGLRHTLPLSPLDWAFITQPQKCCSTFDNRQHRILAGKVLGGSSSVDDMLYVRGSRHLYDEWAEKGCEGWSYSDVLPYFVKAENYTGHAAGSLGRDGPVVVTEVKDTPLAEAFVKAADELGYQRVDVNGEESFGVGYTPTTVKQGLRWSTAKAYLRPAMGRNNLRVITHAHVTKVLTDGKTAVGVEFVHDKTTHQARAMKEVILSAGVFGSPRVLMLSGIGPKDDLKKYKVPVVNDMPVGGNLHMPAYVHGVEFSTKTRVSMTTAEKTELLTEAEYDAVGEDFFSRGTPEGVAFFRSKHQSDDVSYPYIQLLLLGGLTASGTAKHGSETVRITANMEPEVFEALHGNTGNMEGFTMIPILLHPGSRIGAVQLNSSDPFAPLLIEPETLGVPEDVNFLMEAVRIAQKFGAAKSFQALGTSAVARAHPSCASFAYDTDAYWHCHTYYTTRTVSHAVGTCKMGSRYDPTSVVDPQLRVHFMKRLRVVDASVMPSMTSSNTNAPVIMIAEKVADMIRGRKPSKGHDEF